MANLNRIRFSRAVVPAVLTLLAALPARPADIAGESAKSPGASRIERRSQFLPGPWAEGAFGDWKLRNGSAIAAISSVDSELGGGALLDAVRAEEPYDQLRSIEPAVFLGDDIRIPVFESEALNDEDPRSPVLRFRGSIEESPMLQVEHEVGIGAKPNALAITTRVTNRSTTETLYNVGIGDRIQWALLTPIIEYFGAPDPNASQVTYSSWIGGRIDRNSLGIVVPEGQIEGIHSGALTQARYRDAHQLAPGESLEATRHVYIGDEDFSKFTDYALTARGVPSGTMRMELFDMATNEPVAGTPFYFNAYTRFRRNEGPSEVSPRLPFTIAVSDENGVIEFLAPAGRRIEPNNMDVSRGTQPLTLSFEAVANQTLPIGGEDGRYGLTPQTRVRVNVVEEGTGRPLPCKVRLDTISGGFVNYGPSFQSKYRNFQCLPRGKGEFPIPRRGVYEIAVTRGLEYEMETVKIEPGVTGEAIEIDVELERIVDTHGYIAADLGVLTSASPRSAVAARDMVIAAACEGVEWLVSADINAATDLEEAIRAEGLEEWIGATRGFRPKPRKRPFHASFTVFPAPEEMEGELDAEWLDEDAPGDMLARLRGLYPDALLMVNAPNEVSEGYFLGLGVTDQNLGRDLPGLNYDFDIYEVLNGRLYYYRIQNMRYFGELAKQGKTYTPGASSLSLDLFGNEPGYPRTYIGVPDDNPVNVTDEQIVAGLRKGDVVVSNGPFVRLTADGKSPGEIVPAPDGDLTMNLEIQAAPWVSLDWLRIRRNNFFFKAWMRPAIKDVVRFPVKKNHEFSELEFNIRHDARVHVFVEGARGPMPVIASVEGRKAEDFPSMALTGYLKADADGDGEFIPRNIQGELMNP